MVNVYESVSSNKRKSWLVISGFVVFVLLASYLIARGLGGGFEFIGIALVFSGIMSFVSYYWSDRAILAISRARPVNREDNFDFFTVTQNLCLAASLPMPKLYIIDDLAMNAFATGRDPQHASVCATSGLLAKLNRTELEGVIGHELSHITNYDTRLMSIVTILIGLVTLLGDWLLRSMWWGGARRSNRDNNDGGIFLILGIITAVLSPIIAQLIQLAISRRREFLADASSVKLTRQPSGLISALKKLGADKKPLEVANKATAHLYIVNPFKGIHGQLDWLASLFNTHPPLKDRIQALEKMS